MDRQIDQKNEIVHPEIEDNLTFYQCIHFSLGQGAGVVFSSKIAGANRCPYEKTEQTLGLYHIPYTKINSNLTMDLKVKLVKLTEENTGISSEYWGRQMSLKQNIEVTIYRLDFIKINHFQ